MYKPTGFVSARMIAKKRRIWRMPTLVIHVSEKARHHGGKEDRRKRISPCPLFLRGGELNHAPVLRSVRAGTSPSSDTRGAESKRYRTGCNRTWLLAPRPSPLAACCALALCPMRDRMLW